MNKLKSLWASLPHPVQAMLVAFASGFLAAAAHAYEDAGFHMSWGELHHLLPTFVAAGVAAARILYMVPNRPAVPVEAKAAVNGNS
ncbi:MAG: hypothetical protein JWO19_4435 [Bryobacterales bacterium]|nr:hypothetical protein [Bryobacterales bacterium]